MLEHVTAREDRGPRVRVEFGSVVLDDGGAGELIALVRAEQDCCPSLAMSLTIGASVVVEALVPDDDAAQVATTLFGPLPETHEPTTAPTTAPTGECCS